MKRTATLIAALAVATAANAAPVRTATEAYVTNRIAAAVAAIPSPDFTTNNAALVETIQAKTPSPDFTTNNTALVETIEATAPAPGNYAAVSKAAMSAAAQTNDFLRLTGGSMRGPIRFSYFYDYGVSISAVHPGALSFDSTYPDYSGLSALLDLTRLPTDGGGNGSSEIAFISDISFAATAATNYTDRAISAIPAAVTNIVNTAIREQSLGGIWDAEMEVWWTPVMRNGSLTYQATTNVNLNAEN